MLSTDHLWHLCGNDHLHLSDTGLYMACHLHLQELPICQIRCKRQCPCSQAYPKQINSARVVEHTLIIHLVQNIVSNVLRLLLNLHECGATLQMRSFDVLQPVGCAVPIPPPRPLAKIVTLHVYMCVYCCCALIRMHCVLWTHPHALCYNSFGSELWADMAQKQHLHGCRFNDPTMLL